MSGKQGRNWSDATSLASDLGLQRLLWTGSHRSKTDFFQILEHIW